MPEDPSLRPASADEIATSLSFALRYEGRKRVHHADETMARITADRLVRHLEASGFVLMKRAPVQAPTTSHMPSSHQDWSAGFQVSPIPAKNATMLASTSGSRGAAGRSLYRPRFRVTTTGQVVAAGFDCALGRCLGLVIGR
jgi:hypothetical protein